MNVKFIFILVVCAGMQACSPKNRVTTPGRTEDQVVKTNKAHSYQMFLPGSYDSEKNHPLILAFDPHGKGSIPMDLMKDAANKYGFVLVTSNMVKNGLPDYKRIIGELLADVESKASINHAAIVFAGFSGGARMAIHAGIETPGAGVIACGASVAYPAIKQVLQGTRMYNIAGTQDFNNKESSYAPGNEASWDNNYYTTTFVGTHRWPSSKSITDAIEYMYVVMVEQGKIEETESVSDIKSAVEDNVDSLISASDMLGAYKQAERASKMFASGTDFFTDKMKSITENHEFKASIAEINQNVEFEKMLCQGYLSSFDSEPLAWWQKEIKALNDTIDNHREGPYKDMLIRSKGYVGIICYAKCNGALQSGDKVKLRQYLDIYKAVEPANADMMYFTAHYFRMTNLPDSSRYFARKAIGLGFDDSTRVKTELGL